MDKILDTEGNFKIEQFGSNGEFFSIKGEEGGIDYKTNVMVYEFSTGEGYYIQIGELRNNIPTMGGLPRRVYAYGGKRIRTAIKKAETIAREILKNPTEDFYRKKVEDGKKRVGLLKKIFSKSD